MAVLKIYSAIECEDNKYDLFGGVSGMSFSDVDAFIASIPQDDDKIDMRLHCPGGSVSEGWAIVDKLRATGKEISATIEGSCASMATVLLCAAPKERRKALSHAKMLIHEPYYPAYSLPDPHRAKDLEEKATLLRQQTAEVLDFYVERTGADRDELSALMQEEKWIDMDEALRLGFISEIIPPVSARTGKPSAWGKHTNQTLSNMTKDTKLMAAFRALAASMGFNVTPSPVAYELSTESGDTITVDKPEGEAPVVGDPASPDGEHKMPDGTTIVIESGVITEIKPADTAGGDPAVAAEDEKDLRIAELEQQIAELTAENEDLKTQLEAAQKNAKSTEDRQILNLVAMAGGKSWLEQAHSTHKPAGSAGSATSGAVRARTVDPPARESRIAQKLAELKAKQ